MPGGSGIKTNLVPLAVDGQEGTAWITPKYEGYANFGNLPYRKQGSGIIVDLGGVRDVSGVVVHMYRGGQKAQVLAAAEGASGASALADFSQRLTELKTVGSMLEVPLDKPVRTQFLLVHITELPPEGSGFRGGISEIRVLG